MTAKPKNEIQAFFETGDRPTESQFIDFIDSYVDKAGPIGQVETQASGGAVGLAAFDGGNPNTGSIQSYAAARSSMSITVFTTAQVESVISGTSITTAAASAIAAQAISSAIATTAQAETGTLAGSLMDPVLTRNAIFANVATTVQATAGTTDNGLMTPILSRKSIEQFAFTSASYATTAQANAGTDASTVMNPVLTRNAVENNQPSAFGGVGTYILASPNAVGVNAGDTVAGTTLLEASLDSTGNVQTGGALSGTWRNMGQNVAVGEASLFLRIS